MGCGNCGSGSDGKPKGCQSNGGCSSGGCNRLNVFDWLGTIPLSDGAKPFGIVEVSFNKGSRKDYFRNNTPEILEKGNWIVVEGVSGIDVGEISLTGELVKLQMKKYGVEDTPLMKQVLRVANDEDFAAYFDQKQKEKEVLVRSRAMAQSFNLEMKLCEVEIQADGKKATFFYTAESRVDFRELIKAYASEFKVKVEMRQIGARQESAKVGGIGSCGRELCCSTWLSDFKSVNTNAARYQNLSINQTKLSGQCGRLKCCLNYELDTYMDALRNFPNNVDTLQLSKGNASLVKKDIFKNLMWYSFSDSTKQYPLTIERVNEIAELNKKGIKPDELEPVELELNSEKKGSKNIDVGFINDVGQLSLKSLEKNHKKNRNKKQHNSASQKNAPKEHNAGEKSKQNDAARQTQQQQGGKQSNNQHNRQQQGNRQEQQAPNKQQHNNNRGQQQGNKQGNSGQQQGSSSRQGQQNPNAGSSNASRNSQQQKGQPTQQQHKHRKPKPGTPGQPSGNGDNQDPKNN